jgi:hypothetical protein
MQSKINESSDIVFEWVPYNQLYKIEEINNSDSATVYSAIWKDGPLYWNEDNNNYNRTPDKKVVLKCVYNLLNNLDDFLNEV